MRVIRHWNILPRGVVGALLLKIFKLILDESLSNFI